MHEARGSQRTARLPPARLVPMVLWVRDVLARVLRGLAPAALRVIESTNGLIEAKAVYAAAELGVADAIAAGALDSSELAEVLGADDDALGRLLRLLATRGYFRRDRRGRLRTIRALRGIDSQVSLNMRLWNLAEATAAHRN